METDHQHDGIFIGMKGIVHANMKSFEPTIRDHALHVSNLFDNYKNLTHYGYDAETAAFDSILERLGSADYACSVNALGLLPWIVELTSLNDLFKTYVDINVRVQATVMLMHQRVIVVGRYVEFLHESNVCIRAFEVDFRRDAVGDCM
jgi:hypothetical protein